jgi:hypothetical protein
MAKYSIEGKWIGKLNYINNYPEEYSGKELDFEITITVDGDFFKGTCVDDITKELVLQPATIEGIFRNNEILFMKYYPCSVILDENQKLMANSSSPSHGIQYVGAPKLSVSEILKRLKGRSAKILLSEYSELKKRYWGGHLWGIGYGAWITGI